MPVCESGSKGRGGGRGGKEGEGVGREKWWEGRRGEE